MSKIIIYAILALAIFGTGCSSAVDSSYLLSGYDQNSNAAIKRISVTVWSPMDYHQVGNLAAFIASDYIKLRKNYIVHPPRTIKQNFNDACEGLEGVLALRILDISVVDDEVNMQLDASLFRCTDDALLWRTTGTLESSSNDENLKHLTISYRNSVGSVANRFAAPLFALLQQLLELLPNPTLSDDEVIEKIELD
ncbi:MAG: MXAN_6521/LA_1396 family lipoprotein [Deltaproteobacteria bacterium]|nr:MXAN_6521/LA_1396 family lipoprotein [Deltaproteobacteria bacterium]